jgi:hypothetical protein
MNVLWIRRTVAIVLLVVLLAMTVGVGIFVKRFGHRDTNEWLHTFCLTQTILLAACVVYGPGRLVVRIPLVMAWGLGLGFALSMLNLISTQGRASLAAGAILVTTGTLASLVVFAFHRWRTDAIVVFRTSSVVHRSRGYQLSLRMMMTLMAAFAVTGLIARAAINATPDPFGNEHDMLVLQLWLGFFPCLAAAPGLLTVFRPSWKIAIACGFVLLVSIIEPLLLGLTAPLMFEDTSFATRLEGLANLYYAVAEVLRYNGEAVAAILLYALLARAAGFRMLVPDQSKDKKPNPAGLPATEAVDVQD